MGKSKKSKQKQKENNSSLDSKEQNLEGVLPPPTSGGFSEINLPWNITLLILCMGFYLVSVYQASPFIQQEIIGLAYWWTLPDLDFWSTLFDPQRTDGYPGRFRYLEYLAHAMYWNLMASGYLPKDLFDVFNISCVLIMGVLLFIWAREKNLTLWESFLCYAVFFGSVQVFMVGAFHFRKAKVLATLFLIALRVLGPYVKDNRQWAKIAVWIITPLGIITDPYFILFAPVLVFFYEFKTQSGYALTKQLGIGYVIGALIVIFMNAYLAPLYHPKQGLFIFNIPNKPENLLTLANLPHFYKIIPDIFFPAHFMKNAHTLGFLVILALGAPLIIFKNRLWTQLRHYLLFLGVIPVAVFMIVPENLQARFASYYGVTLILFLVFALGDLLTSVRAQQNKWNYRLLSFVVVSLIMSHQFSKPKVFSLWKNRHFAQSSTSGKWHNDYRELQNLKNFLKFEARQPASKQNRTYELKLDVSNIVEFSFRDFYEKGESHLNRQRTTMAYFLFPILFGSDIKAGKVKVSHF